MEIDNHFILPDLRSPSDHTPFTVDIFISEKFIQDKWQTIIKNSEEEEMFVSEFMNAIDNIDTSNISNQESLEETVQEYATISESFWYKYSKSINITKWGVQH